MLETNSGAFVTLLRRARTPLFMAFALLAAVITISLLLPPGTPVTETASAQEATEGSGDVEIATRQMIDYATNLRSAAEFSVFGDRGIVGQERAVIRGRSGNAPRDEHGLRARNDLVKSIDALMQLPCTELESTELGGKTFGPGVYCAPSAGLAGELTLDGRSDPSSVFIFRIDGAFAAGDNSEITLTNGALGSNVYFVAGETGAIGNDSEFRGNLVARGDVSVGQGSDIGKTLTLGTLTLEESNLGNGTGTLQICKAQTGTTDIGNRIFNFTVSGVAGTIAVPVGSCSAPIEVPAGPATITELNTGQTITGGTFTGNFQLVSVVPLTANSPSTLGAVNLAARTAAVNIVEGGTAQQLTLRFTNQFATTGFVEICKAAATNAGVPDPDVTGFFRFTIEGVYTTNTPTTRVLQEFVAPVGQCTGPIAVTVGNPGNPATVRVSELPRAGFFLESARTFPVNREVGQEVLGFIVDANGNVVPAPGGGYITVVVQNNGTPSNETLITFVNRSNAGIVKVCKIAGPGVPVNTMFRFVVRGTGATTAAPPQTTVIGPVERIVDVRAGSPESGGNCQIVPGLGAGAGFGEFQTFVNGTPVRIYETGLTPNVTQPTQPGGTLLVSRILSSSGFSPGVFNPNPDLTPGAEGELTYIARAAVPARSEVIEVEFVDFRFNPATLKVCKIGAGGVTGSFTFDITLVSPMSPGGPIFPTSTTSVTATAGPADQGGFCAIVDASNFPGGGLNAGSTITIVERAVAGSTVTAIDCPTCGTGGLTRNLGTRTATLQGTNGLRGGEVINSVVFTNSPPPVTGAAPALFDFDGDGRSDPSVFRADTGTWWYSASGSGGVARAVNFGISTDRLVAADYDGDSKTDQAIYRNGEWHVLGSTSGYRVVTFGLAGDIPQTGDFDADGKADFVVYRPSEGTWYLLRTTEGFAAVPFGIASDRPVAADYDGDRRSDIAVYRDGTWYMLMTTRGFGAVQFGLGGDRPVAADYDGDGRADQAVYRSGIWHILGSTAGYKAAAFGMGSDIPVEADYDGDGRTDMAVFRPSDGVWHIMRSSQAESGYTSFQFGYGTDTPVPSY